MGFFFFLENLAFDVSFLKVRVRNAEAPRRRNV